MDSFLSARMPSWSGVLKAKTQMLLHNFDVDFVLIDSQLYYVA